MIKIFYFLHLLFLFNYLQFTLQVSTPSSSYYTAAVVEYNPTRDINLSPENRTLGNVRNYLSLLNGVTTDLDIVVFPESTITTGFRSNNRTLLLQHATFLPDPLNRTVVCGLTNENYSQYLIELSCGARNRRTYLVANVLEKRACTGNVCAPDNWEVFNSNVVFDRNGTVVGRYRKFNLFGEYSLNRTSEPELSTFTTDFNVTFGQFICFDLIFDSPPNTLVRNGVRDFVFSAMWFSELPFLTALQAQNQWAYENNVNFLTAGANQPSAGSGGTAIFEGSRGPHIAEIIAERGSQIYVANVTKRTTPSSITNVDPRPTVEEIDRAALTLDNFFLIRDNLDDYSFRLINTTSAGNIHQSLCNGRGRNELCCHFNINITVNATNVTSRNSYNYAFVAFSGVRSFSGAYNGGIETCAIVACTGNNSQTCGLRFSNYSTISWPVTFESITIDGNFTNVSYKRQYPNSLRANLRPLPTSSVIWSYQNVAQSNLTRRILRLVEPQNRLMTFAIFGRDYSRDGPTGNSPTSSSSFNRLTIYCLLITLFVILFNKT